MPETSSSSNTKLLGKMLARTLRQTGIQLRKASEKGESLAQLRKRKEDGLKKVYRLLSLNLGVPPTSFTYTLKDKDGKAISTETYTPQSFYERFVGADLRGQFVMLMNDPSRPYYKVYEIEYDRHAYDGKNWTYVNLPMDEIKQMAIASLKDNTMMYYSCDVAVSWIARRVSQLLTTTITLRSSAIPSTWIRLSASRPSIVARRTP